jgi:hypothetical protein
MGLISWESAWSCSLHAAPVAKAKTRMLPSALLLAQGGLRGACRLLVFPPKPAGRLATSLFTGGSGRGRVNRAGSVFSPCPGLAICTLPHYITGCQGGSGYLFWPSSHSLPILLALGLMSPSCFHLLIPWPPSHILAGEAILRQGPFLLFPAPTTIQSGHGRLGL